MITMSDVMRHCRNWFVAKEAYGQYAIVDGAINLPDLLPGQSYIINGSTFNDGMHDSTTGLVDETFTGLIQYQAIPQDFKNFVLEVQMWEEKYGAVSDSPYQSESFGGYSYTKKDAGNGGMAWYDIPSIKARLSHWRKT